MKISKSDIESLFSVGQEVDSGGRRRQFRITYIGDDLVRIQPTTKPTMGTLRYDKLSVVVDYFATVDEKRIESSVGQLLVAHGLKDTQNETYLYGFAREYIQRSQPKGVLRRGEPGFPDEVEEYLEGATKQVYVNAHERDPKARAACIKEHGVTCVVCGFNFQEEYGPRGEGFIHVHHLKPLSKQIGEHVVIPATDLRPVCPNCHAMLHVSDPPLTIEELVEMWNNQP